VKENLNIAYEKYYIDRNTWKNSYKDLWLMSKCKHIIISNSTFSRRGAYLNQNPDKIVIAPKNWFKRSEYRSSDIIPEDWIKL
jgi:hypothetical protein